MILYSINIRHDLKKEFFQKKIFAFIYGRIRKSITVFALVSEAQRPQPLAGRPEISAAWPEKLAGRLEKLAGWPEKLAGRPEMLAGRPATTVVWPEISAVQPETPARQPEMLTVRPTVFDSLLCMSEIKFLNKSNN
jgi:hypothetical protein